MLDSVKKGSP